MTLGTSTRGVMLTGRAEGFISGAPLKKITNASAEYGGVDRDHECFVVGRAFEQLLVLFVAAVVLAVLAPRERGWRPYAERGAAIPLRVDAIERAVDGAVQQVDQVRREQRRLAG